MRVWGFFLRILRYYRYTDIYCRCSTTRLFLGVFRSFIWCVAAGKTSLFRRLTSSSLCSNLGTQTRISPFAIVASLQQKTIAVVSSVFGRREQCSRRACRHLAGSGSAYQVELRIGEAEGEFENGIWTLALKYSAFLEAVTSDQVIGTTSSLGPIQDTSCRDVVQLRHSRRTKAVATTTFLFSFEHL